MFVIHRRRKGFQAAQYIGNAKPELRICAEPCFREPCGLLAYPNYHIGTPIVKPFKYRFKIRHANLPIGVIVATASQSSSMARA